jgi:hypothetical protein
MTRKNPSELFSFARKQAFKLFHDTGEVLPMWHALAGNGEHLVIATPWQNDDEKDDAVRTLRRLFEHREVSCFVFICEAWAVKLNEPIKPGSRLLLDDLPRPSEHEDRREVLRINAEDRAGNVLSGQYYILRPEHGKPTLSKFEQDDIAGVVSGRMSGLLKQT